MRFTGEVYAGAPVSPAGRMLPLFVLVGANSISLLGNVVR
jgi:hypothetical protein